MSSARWWKADNLIGKKSKLALRGCIRAKSASKLESSAAWLDGATAAECGNEDVIEKRLVLVLGLDFAGGVSSTMVSRSLRSTPSSEAWEMRDLWRFSSIS